MIFPATMFNSINISFNTAVLFQAGHAPWKKYRGYSQENLAKAFKAVKEKNTPVQRAAREFGVPESTLRDRIKGKVSLQKTRSGPPPVLGVKEENKLVEYLQLLTDFGYSFSRSDVTNLATDFAVVLGKREPTDTFTHQWYYSFLSRWPGLVSKRPVGTKQQAEKAASLDCLTNYFHQLQSTLKKYNLSSSPDSLFVIDEICINTDKSPPEVISWRDVRYDKNRQEVRPTLTLIVCGNSTGARLPGFFIFPGRTVSSESIEDCSPGTGATCSDDGSTNSSVFQLYLENHFLKFIERKEEAQPILLLYDGHRTFISPALIELYKKQFVHLFPLPPLVSQALVELKAGIFQDFVARFNEESDDFLESEFERSIHSSVCVVACKAYKKAVNSIILKSFFKHVGIYPFNPAEVDRRIDLSKPIMPVQKKSKEKVEKLSVKWHSPRQVKHQRKQELKAKKELLEQDRAEFEDIESEMFGGKKKRKKISPKVAYRHNYSNRKKSETPRTKKQKTQDQPGVSQKAPKLKLKIRNRNKTVKGKTKSRHSKRMEESTTEDSSDMETESTDSEIDEMLSSDEHDIDDYDAQTRRLEFETSLREELETSRLYFEYNQRQYKVIDSPVKEHSYEVTLIKEQPTTSEEYVYETVVTEEKMDESGNIIQEQPNVIEEQPEQSNVKEQQVEESEVKIKVETVEEEIPTSETCCVCNKYHPDKAQDGYVIEFATWGKCDYPGCEHWTHLKYCCDIKVLRRHDVFHCPCHDTPSP